MKVISPPPMHFARLSQSVLAAPPCPLSVKVQRLGRYSLAIAIGSILPQVYPAIARSMALEEASPNQLPSSLSFQESDAVEPDWAEDSEHELGTVGAPKSEASNPVALTLTLPPVDEHSSEVSPDSAPALAPSPDAEVKQDEPLPESSSWSWFADPSARPSAVEPDAPRDRPASTDSVPSLKAEQTLDQLFAGGTDSLVAKAVGSAEGTRTPEGEKTWAYYGHTDPGNGVHNLGTFSYQHGASSPEEADQRQLLRLQTQARQIQADAESRGMALGIEEQLNAIDLANQAPKAALSYGGYLDRLQEAYQMGLQGSEAILWARVRSYIDPSTQRWNAPGLGNNLAQIEADQRRRMDAIARTMIVAGNPASTDSFSFSQLPEEPVVPRSPATPSPKRLFSGAIDFSS